MKMSLCNTFRFFAVLSTIVLCVGGSPVPGYLIPLESSDNNEFDQDLEPQDSITVELKSDIKGPNYINNLRSHNVKDDSQSIMDSESTKKILNKISYKTSTSTDKLDQGSDAEGEGKTSQITLKLVTEAINPINELNITFTSHQADATVGTTSQDETTNPVFDLETIEKKNLIKQHFSFLNNDITNETQVDINDNITTTIESMTSTEVTLLNTREEPTINTKIDTEIPTNTESEMIEKSTRTMKSSSLTGNITTPAWKKYTVIERNRVDTTTDELSPSINTSTDIVENLTSTIFEDITTVTDKSEVMIKSESAQGRISLQDAITSDIPSLEKLKTDLLSFSKFTSATATESTARLFNTEESITTTDTTTYMTTTDPSTLNSESPNTVSSKRAGYLNLSAKNATIKEDITLKPNETESLQGPFDVTTDVQDELREQTTKVGSQSQLNEDAIKEELMKEELLNDNEEISNRHRAEGKQIETHILASQDTDVVNATQPGDKLAQSAHTTPDENLSVKPINSDKTKNTVLYPVNPNYKPLKKIEVQPAKPFVRDPDDNSWRNESLSSLGIVFKPKNSSKPFTQVLKNKTETEWNNLPEKDIKSDVPDLRERLEQIAQKRKSKKKKFDSFGNVFYTDYEENSSSEENTTTPQVEDPSLGTVSTTAASPSGITIVTPVQTISLSTPTAPVSGANEAPALTTTEAPAKQTQATPKTEPTKVTTLKHPKMFNLFDYYEANDDEDIADYLSMAKIDLKKFTVPIHTTYTPYTSPPLPILYTNPMTHYTQERKGTIQYFPPRTTKRPKYNRYSNVRDKINPIPLTDSPKNVIPISYHKLTTPYDGNVYYAHGHDADAPKVKDDPLPKNFDQNLYLTTPPLTTIPDEDFRSIGDDARYDRPSYVIKHYKEFANEASHEDEHKHREFALTEPPALVTEADYVKPTTTRDKATPTEEYDYEAEFRKDLLERFVADFNGKAGRFRAEYPVVYNNSIVHGASYDDRDVAMSRASLRRPSGGQEYKPLARDPSDPNCDKITVELSPAYELHYYVPEQEEKQEVEATPANLPGRYRL